MISALATILLLVTAPGGVCGRAGAEKALLAELNAARQSAGEEPVEAHPLLCAIARDEAAAVAATGGTPTQVGHINSITRRLYRSGYAPHSWTEGSLIATSGVAILSQWRGARPEWTREAETGDFEHVGIGLASYRGRPVVTLVLALKTRTVEWRQAEPLEDLSWVREVALAEVNRLRHADDREPLTSESRLDAAAQRHAEDMLRREYYDHVSPEGETVRSRARAAGYSGGRLLAENIAKGLFTPDEVVRRWMNSSGKRPTQVVRCEG